MKSRQRQVNGGGYRSTSGGINAPSRSPMVTGSSSSLPAGSAWARPLKHNSTVAPTSAQLAVPPNVSSGSTNTRRSEVQQVASKPPGLYGQGSTTPSTVPAPGLNRGNGPTSITITGSSGRNVALPKGVSSAAPPGLEGIRQQSAQTQKKASLGAPDSCDDSLRVPDIVLRDRFLHLCQSLVGQQVTVVQTNEAVVEGVLHTFTPFARALPEHRNMYVLRACKVMKAAEEPDEVNGAEDANPPSAVVRDGCTAVIPVDRVRHVCVRNFRLSAILPASPPRPLTAVNGTDGVSSGSTSFRTDTEISGRPNSKSGGSKDLVAAGSAWTAPLSVRQEPIPPQSQCSGSSGSDSLNWRRRTSGPTQSATGPSSGVAYTSASKAASGSSSSSSSGLKGSIGAWDQFSANERLFNVRANFDENQYTTELDKSTIPDHMRAKAERLAREIEGTATDNVHLAVERGHKVDADFDEEDLHSGVLRGPLSSTLEPKLEKLEQKDPKMAKGIVAVQEVNFSPQSPSLDDAQHLVSEEEQAEDGAGESSEDVRPAEIPCGEQLSASSDTDENQLKEHRKLEKNAAEQEEAILERATSPPPYVEHDVAHAEAPAGAAAETTDKANAEASVEESAEAPSEVPAETPENVVEQKKTGEEEKVENKKPIIKSKLNANAREFTFNPSAKSFTPTGMISSSTTAAIDSAAVPVAPLQHSQPPAIGVGMTYMAAGPHSQQMHPSMVAAYTAGGNPSLRAAGYLTVPPQYEVQQQAVAAVSGSQHTTQQQQAQQQQQPQQQTQQQQSQAPPGDGADEQNPQPGSGQQQAQQILGTPVPPPYMGAGFYPPQGAHTSHHHQQGQHRPPHLGGGASGTPSAAAFHHAQMVQSGGPQMAVVPGPGNPYMYRGGPIQPGMHPPPQMAQQPFYPPGANATMHYAPLSSYGALGGGSVGGRGGLEDEQQGSFRASGRGGGRGGRGGGRRNSRKGGRGGRGGYHASSHGHGGTGHQHGSRRDSPNGDAGGSHSVSGGGVGSRSSPTTGAIDRDVHENITGSLAVTKEGAQSPTMPTTATATKEE